MKRVIILFTLFSMGVVVYSQDKIIASKELIISIPIGSEKGHVQYSDSEEGFSGPGAPNIDDKGSVWFFSVTNKNIIVYQNKVLNTIEYPKTYPKDELYGPNIWPSVNQQGCFGFTDYPNKIVDQLKESAYIKKINYYNEMIYHLPNGIAIQFNDYSDKGEVVSVEYSPNNFSMLSSYNREYTPRDNEQTKIWLQTQPGGFSIGPDRLLYKNGMLWSAKVPEGTGGSRYIGKLKSGHNVWSVGNRPYEEALYISNSIGKIELQVNIPWGGIDIKAKRANMYNWGLGPWGEMYCLIPPASMWAKRPYKYGGFENYVKDADKITEPAELVVVRNYLKYFGRLNSENVRLRKDPSTAAEIVGRYPMKTGFRILDGDGKKETIDGKTFNWMNIRLLDGTEGWVFGAYVQNLYDGPNGTPPPWPNVADW